MHRTISKRINNGIRERLKDAEQLDQDKRLKASAEAMTPLYSYDPMFSPHEEEKVDARAQRETWDDMLRLQTEGIYPAAFAAIKVPVLMVHGTFDPHPGRVIFKSLQPYVCQLDYRELERCGHYPWLETAAANIFFSLIREWLGQHMERGA
jgi:pimeloyl-ACP methyl ester carboxylesterase